MATSPPTAPVFHTTVFTTPLSDTSTIPKPQSGSSKDRDLKSKNATHTPHFNFPPIANLTLPIIVLRCSNPLGACVATKKWLYTHFDSRVYGTTDILRIDNQELDIIQLQTEGTLLILESVAKISSGYGYGVREASSAKDYFDHENRVVVRRDSGPLGARAAGDFKEAQADVSIMALFMPKDSRVRWFYAVLPFTTLLEKFIGEEWVELQTALEPGTRGHRKLHTFVREEFLKAIKMPEHPDYINAIAITDYAPEIRDPDTALDRLMRKEEFQVKDVLDMEDDRYLTCLTPAEREVASVVQMHCAEYMMVKRTFFKDLYTDVYRSDKNREKGEKVRTEAASQRWLEDAHGLKPTRAKRLVHCWKELGFLDESWFLPWIRKGGMLTEKPIYEDDDDEKEKGSGERAGKAAK